MEAISRVSGASRVSRVSYGASQSPAAESLMSMRGLPCVRPADTHSPQGQVTLLSLLRPIPRVTTCNQRLSGTAACAFTLAGGIPQWKRLQMRVTSPRESSSEFRPKAPSTVTTHAHHHTFLASESEKGLGAGVSRAGKEQARRVGQTMRDPSPGSNPKAQSSSHQRPTVSLQGRR